MTQLVPLLTPREAARRLKISDSTFWRMVNRGELQTYRISQRTIRIKEEDLKAYIQSNRR